MFNIRPQIGVMGGAFHYSQSALESAYIAGKRIAERKCTLVTGGTTGIPFAAAVGAKDGGGLVIGISPAANAQEHVERYSKPLRAIDAVIYTGMGYNGRESLNVASSDAILYIGGEFGTLAEFCHGFYDGKTLGVLTGVGGISDRLREILGYVTSDFGSHILFDVDVKRLVDALVEAAESEPHSAGRIWVGQEQAGEDVMKALADIRMRQT